MTAANTTAQKTHETRLRRMADRQGFTLHKSRRRDPRALDYGEVWLCIHSSPSPETSNDAWVGPFTDDGERTALDLLDEWLHADEERWNDERYLRGRQLRRDL